MSAPDPGAAYLLVANDGAALEVMLAALSPLERARVAALRVPKRRRELALGRLTARRALAAALPARAFAELAVHAAADGAPEPYARDEPLPVALSISHSAGRALAAVRPWPAGATAAPACWLGADCEQLAPRSAGLQEDHFTADERAQVAAAPAPLQPLAATLLWSAKESALKASRQGLREALARVSVAFATDDLLARGSAWRPLRVTLPAAPHGLTGFWCTNTDLVLTVVGAALHAPPRDLSNPEPLEVEVTERG